jgi:LysM repeat protein
MIAGAMVGWRNPARYIAPLALAAAVTATYLIVHHAVTNKHSSTTPATIQTTNTVVTSHGHSGSPPAKFYVVKPGDSLLGIAAKTGVPITAIEALNPSINPNALQPAQRLRLRR